MSIGRNDQCICGSGKKYKHCCINKILKSEEMPFYKVLRTSEPGSVAIIITRERPDKNIQYINILVDMWKIGLKSCFGDKNMSKDKFNSHYAYMCGKMQTDFIECDINEAKWIIKYGLRIANELKLPIPKEFYELKDIIGNLDDVKVEGSLYKCYMCGKNDLPEEAVDCIKDITLHEVERGVCGTPDEIMSLFICEECSEKPEKKK
ncbi:MAG: hypothetical protein AUK59_00400 [Candidatus Altarchaeum sp. CG2_30_32_3053]|nr:MAG: hypothetical protein AUK59_00400 [Candidatus Altarchaeum sp. CG2_30_32_3053]